MPASSTTLPSSVTAVANRHFYAHGACYTMLEGRLGALQEIPPPLPPDRITPHMARRIPFKPIIIDFYQPFLALLPRRNIFKGYILRRLDVSPSNIPIIRTSKRRWQMDEGLVREWEQLEASLRLVLAGMMKVYPRTSATFTLWPSPHRYGYILGHSSRERAVAAGMQARYAFEVLLTSISFYFFLLEDYDKAHDDYKWRSRLMKLDQGSILASWIDHLEDSGIFDLAVPRIGGFLAYPALQEWKELLRIMQPLNMPLGILWDVNHPLDTFDPLPEFVEFYPSPKELCHLTDPQTQPSAPAAVEQPLLALSRVEPYSGQKEGETIWQFLQRRAERSNRHEKREDSHMRLARLDRAREAEKFKPPGRRGALVYVWEAEEGDDFLVRRLVPRADVEDVWEHYTHSQKRYNAFWNQWDLAWVFDKKHPYEYISDSDDDDDDDEDDEEPRDEGGPMCVDNLDPTEVLARAMDAVVISEQETELDVVMAEHSVTIQLNANAAFVELPSGQEENSLFGDDTLQERATYRFGFTDSEPVPQTPPASSIPLSGADIRRILGHGRKINNELDPLDDPLAESITRYFTQIRLFQPRIVDFHLSPTFAQPTKWVSRLLYNATPNLSTFRPSEERWFILDSNSHLAIAICDSRVLLELHRRDCPLDIGLLSKTLVDFGARFQTFVIGPHSPPQTSHSKPKYIGLGYRPSGYNITTHDYIQYTIRRDAFLRSERGRAAILAGGLIARLARDVVEHDLISYGPSDDTLTSGLCLQVSNRKSDLNVPSFYDDELTDDEIALICGTYQIDTGYKFLGDPQTLTLSWWPNPSNWGSSGLWCGVWTEDCETWYQQRLAQLHSGEKGPLRIKEWKSHLRFSKNVKDTFSKYRQLADEYMNTL